MLTRRAALWLGWGVPTFAGGDFWSDKDPSSWSDKETERLLNKSPWAKETFVTFNDPGRTDNIGGGRGPGSAAGVGMGGGGMAGARGGGPPSLPGEDEMRRSPSLRVLVRWESATPMRQAARKPVPPLASQYYIITVSGLPVGGHGVDPEREDSEGDDTRKHLEDQLKQATELVRKGKDPIHPERLQLLDKEGRRTAVFLFSRTPEPLTVEDKEVIFVSAVGALQFKIRFPLKEMMYRGKLDL